MPRPGMLELADAGERGIGPQCDVTVRLPRFLPSLNHASQDQNQKKSYQASGPTECLVPDICSSISKGIHFYMAFISCMHGVVFDVGLGLLWYSAISRLDNRLS